MGRERDFRKEDKEERKMCCRLPSSRGCLHNLPRSIVYQYLSSGQFPRTLAFNHLLQASFSCLESLWGISGFVCSFVYLNIAKFVTKE